MVGPSGFGSAGWGDHFLHRAFVFLLVFFASVTALALGLSAMGVGLGRALVAVLLGLSGVGAALCARSAGAERPSGREAGRAVSVLATLSLLLALGEWIRLLRLTWIRPVYDWDGLYYHVPALHGWVQADRVRWLEQLVDLPFANGYSMGTEVLSFLVHQLLSHDRWIDGSSLWLWPLGLLALYTLAREAGAPMGWALFGAGLAAQVPVFVTVSSTTYVDAAFAVGCWSTLAAVTRWLRRGAGASWVDTILVGAAAGLMCGFKGVGWPFLLLLAAISGVLLLRRPDVGARTWGQVALVAMLVVLVAGYWPLRNLVHAGNPIHPIELRLGEKTLVEGYPPHVIVDQDLPPELESTPRLLRPLHAWFIFDSHRSGHTATGGLGLVWLGLGLPAMIAVALRWRDLGPRWWAVFLVLFLLIQPGSWWSRFTLWVHGLGLPAAAAALGRSPGRWAIPWATVVLLMASWETHRAVRVEEGRGWSDHGYLATADYYFPGWTARPWADDLAAATHVARGRWGRMGNLLGGALSLPLEQRRIRVLTTEPSAEDLSGLAARGVQWLIWDVRENGLLHAETVAVTAESYRYVDGELSDFQLLRLRR